VIPIQGEMPLAKIKSKRPVSDHVEGLHAPFHFLVTSVDL